MQARILRVLMISALVALTGALIATAPVGARGGHHHKNKLKANLKGANEVPGPGDADGRGKASIRVRPAKGRVCFRLRWKNIAEPPTKAHIHNGAKGVAGPVVVTLFDGTAVQKGCVDGLDQALLRDIKRHPRQYYVNVHNAEFPDGAIRGQLKRTGRHRGDRHRRRHS